MCSGVHWVFEMNNAVAIYMPIHTGLCVREGVEEDHGDVTKQATVCSDAPIPPAPSRPTGHRRRRGSSVGAERPVGGAAVGGQSDLSSARRLSSPWRCSWRGSPPFPAVAASRPLELRPGTAA